jgi:hypothetical protein
MRHLAWPIAAAVLLVPAAAMQITNEVRWDAADFIIFGGMLIAACLAVEATMALAKSRRYRIAGSLAIVATFFVVWLELAVGIMGSG